MLHPPTISYIYIVLGVYKIDAIYIASYIGIYTLCYLN